MLKLLGILLILSKNCAPSPENLVKYIDVWISVFYCLFCPLMELLIHIKDLIQLPFSGTFATDCRSSWIRLFAWKKRMTNAF